MLFSSKKETIRMTKQEFFDLLNITGHENEHLEFKEAKASYSTLGDINKRNCIYAYCVALGNELGGKLILGMDNNKEIVGTNACENLEIVKKSIYEKLGIRIEIDVFNVDDKRVLVIKIPSRPVGGLLRFYGIPLMRIGEDLRDMDEQTQRNILNEVKEDWSAKIVQNATLDDISDEAVLVAKENFSIKNGRIPKREIDEWDKSTFLKNAKLLKNGKITNTAIILLGKPESRDLLSPYVAQITWMLLDSKGDTVDYQHFYPPFILSVSGVYSKIRNLKYRYIKNDLFPEEIDKYDPYLIREALNNCIAHQDYEKCSRINVIEKEDRLIFENAGSFIPGTVENVIEKGYHSIVYRNKFLAEAMLGLNMIDTVGRGIRKMFMLQKERLFPLPDYDLDNERVKLEIIGSVIDKNYAQLLLNNRDISLRHIMYLDKLQKGKNISKQEADELRRLQYIEGRYPNIYISASIAETTNEKSEYLKHSIFGNRYCEDIIIKTLKEVSFVDRRTINDLLLNNLPKSLTREQKNKKISNILHRMHERGIISNIGTRQTPKWVLVRNK